MDAHHSFVINENTSKPCMSIYLQSRKESHPLAPTMKIHKSSAMKKVYYSILALAAAIAPLSADAWAPVGDHIATPWAADINPEKP